MSFARKCDRCGAYCDNLKDGFYLTLKDRTDNYSQSPVIWTVDLCEKCAHELNQFLHIEKDF